MAFVAAGRQAFYSAVGCDYEAVHHRPAGGVIRSARRQRRRFGTISLRAASSTVEFEEGTDEKTRWAGDDPLARVMSAVIAIKPLYNVLKFGAKTVMVRTAERSGIPWKQMVEDLRASEVYAEKDLVEDIDICYPHYYKKPFHGYKDGNLCWESAFEVEPATIATWKRAYPSIDSAQEAGEMVRRKWLDEIEAHHTKFSNGRLANAILDIGCSTGNSTRRLRDRFPVAQVTGLDLSPYFLAVARYAEKLDARNGLLQSRLIHYIHANAEDTGLPSNSFDIISYAFVVHECPRSAVANFLREARRLLRPGGTIAFTEHSPKSKVIQNLPPAIAILMKSTEPWLDEFHMLNLEHELEKNGFINSASVLTDPRHFTLTATAG